MTSCEALAWASGPACAARALYCSVSARKPSPLDRGVAFVLRLERGGLLFALAGLLVGLGLGDPGLAGDRGGVRGGEVLDVAGGVVDLLDLEGVHHDAELLHLAVAARDDLLGDPVALADDLLHGQSADDGTQVAREDPAGELLHLFLLGQEAARRVGDGHGVVTDLEDGDGPNVEADALLRHAVLGDLRLAQRQGEHARLLFHREHETAVTGDDPELGVQRLSFGTGYEHRLVGGGNVPEEHRKTPAVRLCSEWVHRCFGSGRQAFHDHTARRDRVDDNDAHVPVDRRRRPCGVGL